MTHQDQRKYLEETIKLFALDEGADMILLILFDLLAEIAENTKK
jgi:hypothetical protein